MSKFHSDLYPHLTTDSNGILQLNYNALSSPKKLPLVLCGPILRRVEPSSVSVWIALQDSAKIELEIKQGGNQLAKSDKQKPIKIGNNLYIGVVTVDLNADLRPGTLYQYDLLFDGKKMNEAGILSNSQGGLKRIHPEEKSELPSFSLPPEDKNDVRIFHASCRKPHGERRGALPAVLKALQNDNAYQDPMVRPHMLFLTGDQIYGDDVAGQLFTMLWNHARGLRGNSGDEQIPDGDGTLTSLSKYLPDNRQTVVLDEASLTASEGYGTSHLFGLSEYLAMYLCVWSDVLWPDETHVKADAQGDTHEAFPTIKEVYARGDAALVDNPPLPQHLINALEEEYSPSTIPERLEEGTHYEIENGEIKLDPDQVKWNDIEPEDGQSRRGWSLVLEPAQELYNKRMGDLYWFRKELPKVRKILANVPTYMMWDDHEVTDDWFVDGLWAAQALNNQMGHRIIQNGMVAACLCQMWGNTPDRFGGTPISGQPAATGNGLDLLRRVATGSFSTSETYVNTSINSDASEAVDDLLGIPRQSLAQSHMAGSEGEEANLFSPAAWNRTDGGSGRIKYHFGFCPGDYAVAVFDTRTWRAFTADKSKKAEVRGQEPPEVISINGQLTQMADISEYNSPWYDGYTWNRDTPLVALAAVPLWTPLIVDYGQEWGKYLKRREKKLVKSVQGRIAKEDDSEMVRANAYADYEHWRLQPGAMEHFLNLLAKMSKYVVLLSGDVHYGMTTRMEYWYNYDKLLILDSFSWSPAKPYGARFANLTASPSKNESGLTRELHGSGYVHGHALASMGWYGTTAPSNVQAALDAMETGTSWYASLKQTQKLGSLLLDGWGIARQSLWQRYVVEPLPEDKIRQNVPWRLFAQQSDEVKKLIEEKLERTVPVGFKECPLTSPRETRWDSEPTSSIISGTALINGSGFSLDGVVNAGSVYFAGDATLRFNIADIPVALPTVVANADESDLPFLKMESFGNLDVDYLEGDLVIEAQRVRAQELKGYLQQFGFVKTANGLLTKGADAFEDLAGRANYNVDVPDKFTDTDYYIQILEDVQGENETLEIFSDNQKKSVEPRLWKKFKSKLDAARSSAEAWWVIDEIKQIKADLAKKVRSTLQPYAMLKKGLKPHWEYRVDYLHGIRNFYPSSFSADKVSVFRTAKPLSFAADQKKTGTGDSKEIETEWKAYGDEENSKWGSEIIGHNNVGEVTFNFKTFMSTDQKIRNGEVPDDDVVIKEVNHTLWWRVEGTEKIHPYTTFKVDMLADAKGIPVRKAGLRNQSNDPTDTITFSSRPSDIIQRTYGDPDEAIPERPRNV